MRQFIKLIEDLYHGSPYRIDRFSTDHVGSGEGNQAYGWGLYFASKKEVADYYQKSAPVMLVNGKPIRVAQWMDLPSDSPEAYAAKAVWSFGKTAIWALKKAIEGDTSTFTNSETASKALELVQSDKVKPTVPTTYQVSIPDGHFLDWDHSLNEQSTEVKQMLASSGLLDKFLDDPKAIAGFHDLDVPASGFYIWLASGTGTSISWGGGMTPRGASMALAKAGIMGIKYLDELSRDSTDNTHNYVVFDDKHVTIK